MAIATKPTGKSAIWGVTATTGDTLASAKIVSMSVKNTIEKELLLNSVGETAGLCLYDPKTELQIEVICESSVTPPTIGGDFIVNGVTGTVLDVETKWENKGWKKLSVSATNFPNLETSDGVTRILGAAAPAAAQK
jgi:hypothetical protein